MKYSRSGYLCVLALSSAVAYSQQAQPGAEQQREQNQNQRQIQQQTRPGQAGERSQLEVTPQDVDQRVSEVNKSSNLVGMNVKNMQNETLGKISDLAIDLNSGKVAYAVLSVGGFLGIGDKLIAVPIQAFAVEKGAEHLLLDLDKQRAEQAAGFAQNNWPDLNAVERGQAIGLAQTRMREAGTPGDEPGQVRGGQAGAITSLQSLTTASDANQLHGKQVRLSSAKVLEVAGKNLLAIGTDENQKVFVKTQQDIQQLRPGSTVMVTGTVRKTPENLAQIGLDQSAAQRLEGQKLYIEATQVTPAPQR